MCSRQNTKMLALDPLVYQALCEQDEKDRQQLHPKDYYSILGKKFKLNHQFNYTIQTNQLYDLNGLKNNGGIVTTETRVITHGNIYLKVSCFIGYIV